MKEYEAVFPLIRLTDTPTNGKIGRQVKFLSLCPKDAPILGQICQFFSCKNYPNFQLRILLPDQLMIFTT